MLNGAVLRSYTLGMPSLTYRACKLLLLSRMKSHSVKFVPTNLNVRIISSLNTCNKD